MLPLTEIRDQRAHVDDAWRSPIADAAAAAWDIAPGIARYWRSSATHVFVVPVDGVRRWLRFAPIWHPAADRIGAGVLLSRRWAGAGAAQPIPTADGGDFVDVDAPSGRVRATLYEDVVGTELSADGADEDRASDDQVRAWGAALATLHSAPLDDGALPPQRTHAATADAALADHIAELEALVTALPPSEHGIIHGDFELDNVRFDGDLVRFFDVDEGGSAPFATDIALATRDLDDPGLRLFIDGYRSVRALDDRVLELLPTCARLAAAHLAVDTAAAVDLVPAAGDPDWLVGLHADLVDFIADQRSLAGLPAER